MIRASLAGLPGSALGLPSGQPWRLVAILPHAPWPWGLVDFVAQGCDAGAGERSRHDSVAALHRAIGPRCRCSARRRQPARRVVHARWRLPDLWRQHA